jgi:hypothetical protein
VVALRCTRKLAELLVSSPMTLPEASTTALGDWYGGLALIAGGDLAVFVNERTLLAVAVPLSELRSLIPLFYRRVANLLSMIGIPNDLIDRELREMQALQLATTKNRRVLGAMNEVVRELQSVARRIPLGTRMSLSDVELRLSEHPHGALRHTSPALLARDLLTSTGMWRDT